MNLFVKTRYFFAVAATRPICTNALWVSFWVGSVLNAINQGEAFIGADPVSWPHVVLNYTVPFCVASFSAARHQMSMQRTTVSANGNGHMETPAHGK
jgi:hypothetical protein